MREFFDYATRVALFGSMLAVLLAAPAARADAPAPVKLAVFEFELEDFSGGASILPANPSDFEQLKLVTNEARRLIAQSGALHRGRCQWRGHGGCEDTFAAKL